MDLASQTPIDPRRNDPLPEVLECLARGGAVIAANPRAARELRRLYGAAQIPLGKAAWQTPSIYDWESWLGVLWQQHLLKTASAPLLLTALQERSIWRRIITRSGVQASVTETMAVLAASAWKLLSDFRCHEERWWSWRGRATVDAEAFREWAEAFERECGGKQWTSRSDLAATLTRSIEQRTIELPTELLLIGFDRITPAQGHLLVSAQVAGCQSTLFEAQPTMHIPLLVAAKDLHDELAICAWWARRKIEANPEARIGVIALDINAARGEIERTFRRILMPESTGIDNNDPMPFEFSLGQPLATVPVIQAALLMLRWVAGPLHHDATSWLMMSPFVSADESLEEHASAMGALDAKIRAHSKMPPDVPLEAMAAHQDQANAEPAHHRWFAILRKLRRSALDQETTHRTKSIPDWVDFSENILKQCDWPGARSLESNQFQALRRWERLISEVSALGFDGTRIGYGEFVTMLDRYANEAIFAAESRDAPVQIMGPLESSGQQFDAVWFLGADGEQWPASAAPHPLLPLPLQLKATMPHASIEVDWRLTRDITERIVASAPECVFSYALRDDAGEQQPSAVLLEAAGRPLRSFASDDMRATLHVSEPQAHRRETIRIEDETIAPWPIDLDAGGAGILKSQSACAFQAFAMRRLGAKDLDSLERGVAPSDRGDLLHKVLEALWSKANPDHLLLQTGDDIRNAKASGRLDSILIEHIDNAFKQRAGGNEERGWRGEYLRLEKRRLHLLLSQWLDVEAERLPFRVLEHEKRLAATIGDLKLNLRVDRVDEVPEGKLILDYKTGKVSPSMWQGKRPDDPQLPLYAVYGGVDDLRGVLFAGIRPGVMRLSGYSPPVTATATNTSGAKKKGRSQKTSVSLLDEDVLEEWSVALKNLAEQFLRGDAAVTPKNYPKTCKHCGLQGLCRVAESSLVLEVEDEEEFAGDGEAGASAGE